MGYIVGIDTGGTFTDGIVVDTETMQRLKLKVPTTPYDLNECFVDLLKGAAEKLSLNLQDFLSRCENIRYSQTIATNTIITRTGIKLGLIVTRGHEDDLYLSQRVNKWEDKRKQAAFSFISRDMVAGIDESVDDSGRIVKPASTEEILSTLERLIDLGARAIVISLKNSYLNQAHEIAIRNVVKSEYPPQYLGRVPTFLSSDVARIKDDHARTFSALIDAYVHSKMATYLYKAEDFARENKYGRPLLLVNSDSALSTIARTKALSTIGSGPAAGLSGAYTIARGLYGSENVVTYDIGGTSLDIGLVKSEAPEVTYYVDLEGDKIFQPMIDVTSVAIGGGSIVHLEGKDIQVGPKSAGSAPGPACFDRGGVDPTPTDANLLLGYLNPDNFLGGRIKLNTERSKEVIDNVVAKPLGIDDIFEASYAVRKATDKKIIDSMRAFLQEKSGGNQRKFIAYSYGGGGPVHVCSILSAIPEIESAYVFPFSSEFSAMGCCLLEMGHHYYRELSSKESGSLDKITNEMMETASKDMAGEGFSQDSVSPPVVGIYANGGATFTPVGDDSRGKIEQLQRSEKEPMVLSLKWQVKTAKAEFRKIQSSGRSTKEPVLKGKRSAYWPGLGLTETSVYELDSFTQQSIVKGPCIIESEDATVVLEPKFQYSVDEYGNGYIKRTT